MIRPITLTLREIRLKLREPFRISSGVVLDRRVLLVELVDENGSRAWSECVAGEYPNYSPETVDTAWFAIEHWLAPRVLGTRFEHPDAVHAVLNAGVRGHEMAKAALEMGCWVLESHVAGQSLSRLLGGVRSRIPVGISLGIQASPADLVARARAAHDDGYQRIKLKIQPGSDIEYVAAVREALPDVRLTVDANNAYTPADTDRLRRLDEFRLEMIEQPLEREDLVRHAALQAVLNTAICLDESITSVARAEDMLALKAGRIINIKPGRVGGFHASRRIHDLCEQNGVPVWCGGMLESGIGRAHNVALASLSNFSLPGDLSPSARYWERDIVKPEWTMSGDGFVTVPRDAVGLGVQIDLDFIEDLTVRRTNIRS